MSCELPPNHRPSHRVQSSLLFQTHFPDSEMARPKHGRHLPYLSSSHAKPQILSVLSSKYVRNPAAPSASALVQPAPSPPTFQQQLPYWSPCSHLCPLRSLLTPQPAVLLKATSGHVTPKSSHLTQNESSSLFHPT